MYPENTLISFGKAMEIPGLSGVELDIQLTKDGELVVIHDERVDRTTDGFGFVRDYTLKELKQLHIFAGKGNSAETIPTMREVIELLLPELQKYTKALSEADGDESKATEGMRINIELKTSVYNYPGIEEKIVKLVDEMGVKDAIVYSSFYPESLFKIHEYEPTAKLGVLDELLSNCYYKAIGLESLWRDVPSGSIALHPWGLHMDLPKEKVENCIVRAWYTGHLYPEASTGKKMDFEKYEKLGITDVFLNEPEIYLG